MIFCMKSTEEARRANAVYRPGKASQIAGAVIRRTVARRTDHGPVKSEDAWADGANTSAASLYQLRKHTMTLTTTKSPAPAANQTLQQHHLMKLAALAATSGLLFAASAAFAATGFTVQRTDEAQIKVGMDKSAVMKLLGRPAHNVKYRSEPGRAWTYGVLAVDSSEATSSTLFDVDFDANGKVLSFNERVEPHHTAGSTAQ